MEREGERPACLVLYTCGRDGARQGRTERDDRRLPALGALIMSEYQYYEFLAVDRPLTVTEQAEVREFSTRARITGTSFTNEYHWGDFRGDPSHLMQRYYDAHLYLANWGTHRIMLRLPACPLAARRPALRGSRRCGPLRAVRFLHPPHGRSAVLHRPDRAPPRRTGGI